MASDVIMFARIDGGPLQAKHQAATVIHPVDLVSKRKARCGERLYLATNPKIEEQQVRDSQTTDTAHQQLGRFHTISRHSVMQRWLTYIAASSARESPTVQAPIAARNEP